MLAKQCLTILFQKLSHCQYNEQQIPVQLAVHSIFPSLELASIFSPCFSVPTGTPECVHRINCAFLCDFSLLLCSPDHVTALCEYIASHPSHHPLSFLLWALLTHSFWDRVLPQAGLTLIYGQGWPWTLEFPVSVFQVQGLSMSRTTIKINLIKIKNKLKKTMKTMLICLYLVIEA